MSDDEGSFGIVVLCIAWVIAPFVIYALIGGHNTTAVVLLVLIFVVLPIAGYFISWAVIVDERNHPERAAIREINKLKNEALHNMDNLRRDHERRQRRKR
jgi:multisubunit Na+/H+ antiporter MnhG subunit